MPNGLATTVLLIRHAERDQTANPDPHLNANGKARAKTLLHVAGKSGLKAIYTSHFIRTRETAQPLASLLSLTPIQIDEAADLKNDILSKQSGKTVLVVGHTDTIPALITQLGGGDFTIGDKEFDKLFVLTFFDPGTAGVTELRYGNQS